MNNVYAIARREVLGYFGHPLAYIVLTLFLCVLAVPTLWFQDVFVAGRASLDAVFRWMSAAFVFFVPAITMRLLAEEKSSGSLEIIGTLPISTAQVIVGKWLAAVVLVLIALGLTFTWPIALSVAASWSEGSAALDWGPVVGGYLGLGMIGAAFAAIGTATSTLTRYQPLALLGAFVVCLVPWALGFLLASLPPELQESVVWIQYLTIEFHFANLARGVLDSRSLFFFLGVTLLALRLAVAALESRRLS